MTRAKDYNQRIRASSASLPGFENLDKAFFGCPRYSWAGWLTKLETTPVPRWGTIVLKYRKTKDDRLSPQPWLHVGRATSRYP